MKITVGMGRFTVMVWWKLPVLFFKMGMLGNEFSYYVLFQFYVDFYIVVYVVDLIVELKNYM